MVFLNLPQDPLPGPFSYGLSMVSPFEDTKFDGLESVLADLNSSLLSLAAPIMVFVSAFRLPVQGIGRQPWFRTLCWGAYLARSPPFAADVDRFGALYWRQSSDSSESFRLGKDALSDRLKF